jgi:hypothetical protein
MVKTTVLSFVCFGFGIILLGNALFKIDLWLITLIATFMSAGLWGIIATAVCYGIEDSKKSM